MPQQNNWPLTDTTELERELEGASQPYSDRIRIIILSAQGRKGREIAEELGVRPSTVSKWRCRYERYGIEGLRDAPRSGKPPTYSRSVRDKIAEALQGDPPPGARYWTGPLIAETFNVSEHFAWQMMRRERHRPQPPCEHPVAVPEFRHPYMRVLGLYLNAAEAAIVVKLNGGDPAAGLSECSAGRLICTRGELTKLLQKRSSRGDEADLYTILRLAGRLRSRTRAPVRGIPCFGYFMRLIAKHMEKRESDTVLLISRGRGVLRPYREHCEEENLHLLDLVNDVDWMHTAGALLNILVQPTASRAHGPRRTLPASLWPRILHRCIESCRDNGPLAVMWTELSDACTGHLEEGPKSNTQARRCP